MSNTKTQKKSQKKTQMKTESIFKRIGGKPALEAAVEIFYQKVSDDMLLSPFFEEVDFAKQKEHMVKFLSYAFGGNKSYRGKSLGEAHAPLKEKGLNESHFVAVAEHLEDTLKELKIKKQLRDEVLAIVATTKNEVLGIKNEKTMALGKNLKEDQLIPDKESNGKENKATNADVDFLQVMEGSVLSIVMIDKKGTIQFFNESAEKLWGYERKEVIGKNVKMLTPPDIQKEHDGYLSSYNQTGKKNVMGGSREVKALRKDGSLVDVFLSLSEAETNGETVYVSFIQDISEKKKLEQEVQQQLEETKAQEEEIRQNMEEMTATQEEMQRVQRRTEEILNQAIDSVITIDADKKVLFYNKAAEKMFGYTREEVIGENVKMLVPMEHRGNHDQYVDSNIKTGVNKVVGLTRDLEMTRKDGSKFWGNLSLSKVDIGGELQYTAFIKDITQQREDTMKAQQVQAAVDTGWASIEFHPDGTIITANNNFVQTLGYSDESELQGEHHRIFCDPEYASSMEYKNFWKELAAGKVNSGEFKRFTKQGDEVWINASYTPVRDAEGNIVKVIKIANNITDMIEARLQGEHIQEAVDTGWAFIEFRPDGTIVNANKNFVSALGYGNKREIVGQHHRIFCESQYANSAEYQEFWRSLGNGNLNSGEYKRITKDGKDIWINATYTPVKDNEGNVIKVIKIATDISRVKIPVMKVSEIITEMSKGNLTEKFDMDAVDYVQDMGQALNVAIENLRDILSTIDTSAQEVASSADNMMDRSQGMKSNTAEVASAISQMSKGAQDQAQKTDESSKLAEQVLESASDMESKSDVINRAAEKGVKSCEEGLKIIKNLVENMGGINESAGLTSESIKVLTERAEEIARTLNVITDIAAQTNLLALNAAIEAARAGEAGRGFAVVAEEIRKLAEDSRKSAVDIEKIIGDVQKDTQSASKAIDTMTVSVKEGSGATKEAESIFEEIAESSEETLSMSKSIKEASGKQKSSIDTVVKNIEQIVVVAEETAAGTEEIATSSASLDSGMEEVAAASDQLTKIASDLKMKVSKFKLN